MNTKVPCLAVVASSAVFSAAAFATPIAVTSYSFDVGVPQDGNPATQADGDDYVGALPTGWTGPGGVLTTRPNSYFDDKLADSPDLTDTDENAWSNGGTFAQVLSATLQANSVYTLTVDVGDRTDTPFPAVTLGLGTGNTNGQNMLTPSTTVNPAPADGGWATWTSTFTTGAAPAGLGQPLRIELVSGGIQAQFDNVRLDVVPEPTAAALLAGGALAVLGRRRRAR